MKVYIFLTLLVAASAAPAPRAIDWDKIEKQIRILRDGMYTSGIEYIKSIAIADNPDVGLIIFSKLNEAAVNGKNLLNIAYAPIQERNVTGYNMRNLLAAYGLYIDDALSFISEDLQQLSWETRSQIYDYFYVQDLFELYNYIQIPLYLEEIPLNPVNWDAARLQFLDIVEIATEGSGVLKESIEYYKPNMTGEIFPIIEAAEAEGFAKIDEAISRINNKNLTLREAIEVITELHNVLDKLEGDIYEFGWSNQEWFGFMLLFNQGFTNSHLVGLQIYDALTGVDFLRSSKENKTLNHSIVIKHLKNVQSK